MDQKTYNICLSFESEFHVYSGIEALNIRDVIIAVLSALSNLSREDRETVLNEYQIFCDS